MKTEVGARACANELVRRKDLVVACTDSSVGVGSCDLANGNALQRGVKSLSDQDRACNGQVVLAGDQRGTAEVGRSANALEDGREGDEALDILVGEGVGALLDGLDTSGGQSAGEKADVLLLIVCDVLEVLVVLSIVSCTVVSVTGLGASGKSKHVITYRQQRTPQQRTCPGHPGRRRSPGARG